MTFQLPESVPDTIEALRMAESQTPKELKNLKPLLLQAANELCDFRRVAADSVRELTEAAELRSGMMDSDSRAAEVQRQIRLALTGVTARLRALLEK